jgi:hypothetical protein
LQKTLKNPIYMIKMQIGFTSLLITMLLGNVHYLNAQEALTNLNASSITMLGRHHEQARLQSLVMSALHSLSGRFPETRTNENLRISACIDFSQKEGLVRFAWYGKPGDRWYTVVCSLSGEVLSCEVRDYEQSDRPSGKSIPKEGPPKEKE